jgi:hypothetical protein
MAVAGEKADRLLLPGSVFSYSPVDLLCNTSNLYCECNLCCEGLWEFPSTAVPADASPKARSKAIDAFLEETLGLEGWRDQVIERRGLGAITHIFSHIRMTMHVERLVLQVLPVWNPRTTSYLGLGSTKERKTQISIPIRRMRGIRCSTTHTGAEPIGSEVGLHLLTYYTQEQDLRSSWKMPYVKLTTTRVLKEQNSSDAYREGLFFLFFFFVLSHTFRPGLGFVYCKCCWLSHSWQYLRRYSFDIDSLSVVSSQLLVFMILPTTSVHLLDHLFILLLQVLPLDPSMTVFVHLLLVVS